MMFLKPDGRIDLEHRAYFLRGASHRSVVIAAAEDGQLSILSADLKEMRSSRLSSKVLAVSPHPSERLFAWADGVSGALVVQNLDGSRFLEIPPPQLDGSSNWIKQGFEDCHFEDDGEYLWLVAPRSAEKCEIQLIETKSWALVEKTTVEDPFGGSSSSFHPTGRPALVALWLAAGQDGQQVYWLKRTHTGFSITLEGKLRNTTPPVFSPSSDQVLAVNEDHAICKFDFPKMQLAGLPLKSEDDENNPFAESLCYLGDRQVLVSTNEQRIFVVDAVHMSVEAEVSLDGHEPRPIGEYYPRLAKETGLGTDISWFSRLGDVLFFIYRRDGGTGLTGWKDSLLWLSVKRA
jgi:hypothetical protein